MVALDTVANTVKNLPRDYMDASGTEITEAMRTYARPLIQGEVPIRIADGLPEFVRFRRQAVPRKLAAFNVK
jgi:6-phosphofructokinase 1